MQCNGIVIYIEFTVEINCVQRVEARYFVWEESEKRRKDGADEDDVM